jgi:hypothetical protein
MLPISVEAKTPDILLIFFCTLAAERQAPDFLIGPRNKKPRKKRSPIEILLPTFPVRDPAFSRFITAFCRTAN